MRHAALLIFFAPLSACASWRSPPLDPSTIGLREADVVAAEQDMLAYQRELGRRGTMRSADRVDQLRCDTRRSGNVTTPRCRYRLYYTDLRGRPRVRTRKNRFFERGPDGSWESVIVVTGA